MSPRHIAFIMDGNRRWARREGVSLRGGYQEGLEALKRLVPLLIKKNVPCGTFFAFSTENWKRSAQETSLLQDVVENALGAFQEFADEHDMRVYVIGDVSGFRPKIQKAVQELMDNTRHHKTFHAQVAAGYGGMQDIVQAAKAWAAQEQAKDLTLQTFENYLQAQTLGPVDILVRTGGKKRLSNFLLWQCAYADLFFLDSYWPDLTCESVEKVLEDFSKIKRSYGA